MGANDMSKQRTIMTAVWAVLVLLMVGLIASRGLNARETSPPAATVVTDAATAHVTPAEIPPYEVPPFSLTDQEGRTVTRDDLKGHVWVAAFIFTRCSDTCPMMSTKMAKLQKNVADPSVKLVSFSVDPAHDTADVLKTYAAKFDADPDRWHLLTGDRTVIEHVAWELKLATQMAEKPENITHSDRFVLIDRDGKARGMYSGGDDEMMTKLAADATALASKGSVQ
jgi:protein SCO1/2